MRRCHYNLWYVGCVVALIMLVSCGGPLGRSSGVGSATSSTDVVAVTTSVLASTLSADIAAVSKNYAKVVGTWTCEFYGVDTGQLLGSAQGVSPSVEVSITTLRGSHFEGTTGSCWTREIFVACTQAEQTLQGLDVVELCDGVTASGLKRTGPRNGGSELTIDPISPRSTLATASVLEPGCDPRVAPCDVMDRDTEMDIILAAIDSAQAQQATTGVAGNINTMLTQLLQGTSIDQLTTTNAILQDLRQTMTVHFREMTLANRLAFKVDANQRKTLGANLVLAATNDELLTHYTSTGMTLLRETAAKLDLTDPTILTKARSGLHSLLKQEYTSNNGYRADLRQADSTSFAQARDFFATAVNRMTDATVTKGQDAISSYLEGMVTTAYRGNGFRDYIGAAGSIDVAKFDTSRTQIENSVIAGTFNASTFNYAGVVEQVQQVRATDSDAKNCLAKANLFDQQICFAAIDVEGSTTDTTVPDDSTATATRLQITVSPASVTQSECSSPYTVQRQSSGTVGVSSGTTTVTLSANQGTVTTYSDANCTASTASFTIANGGSTAVFYLQDSAVESFTLTATATGLTQATASVAVLQTIDAFIAALAIPDEFSSGVIPTNAYTAPASENLSTFQSLATALLNGTTTGHATTLTTLGYQLVFLTNDTIGTNTAVALQEASANGQGIYLFHLSPTNDFIFSAPHPLHDAKTALEASYFFQQLKGRALFIAGTHRCANDPVDDGTSGLSACSGTTTACNDSGGNPARSYPISDMAHTVTTYFHEAHKAAHNFNNTNVTFSLHGMADADGRPLASVSNGRTTNANDTKSTTLADAMATNLSGTVDSCNDANDGNLLCGTTNTQGRYANGVTTGDEACTTAASSASERFFHIEQLATIRDSTANWTKVKDAIDAIF